MKLHKDLTKENVCISLSDLLAPEMEGAYSEAEKNIRTILTVTNVTSPKAQESASEFVKFLNEPVKLDDGSLADVLPANLFVRLDNSTPNAYLVSTIKTMATEILAIGVEFKKYELDRINVDPYAKKVLDTGKKVYGFAVAQPVKAIAK